MTRSVTLVRVIPILLTRESRWSQLLSAEGGSCTASKWLGSASYCCKAASDGNVAIGGDSVCKGEGMKYQFAVTGSVLLIAMLG